MRKLSKEELYPSYEEQMAEYRKIFSKNLPPDGNLQDIPPELFWEIIDFLARQPREDLWRLVNKYSIKRINRDDTRVPKDNKNECPDEMLLRFFCSNTIEELYEFREQEIYKANE